MATDTSSVFHRDMLDKEHRTPFLTSKPWIFDSDEYQQVFETETEACAHQRAYRTAKGFDALSGE